MSIEIKTRNLNEIETLANTVLEQIAGTEKIEDRVSLEADLQTVIDAYALESKAQCYQAAKDSGDPMKYACTAFFYEVLAVKEDRDEVSKAVIGRHLEKALRPIDLGDLHKRLEGIGANKMWIHTAEKLNYYLTYRAADRVGAAALSELLTKKSDVFYMHEIARKVDLGKNPVSNTNLLKSLQQVITEMLGDGYKATSHDVNYLVDVYSNDNKKSKTGISAANHKTLRNYLKKVCYRILTGGTGYDVDQREIKAKD